LLKLKIGKLAEQLTLSNAQSLDEHTAYMGQRTEMDSGAALIKKLWLTEKLS
jgi:hypothetical protein